MYKRQDRRGLPHGRGTGRKIGSGERLRKRTRPFPALGVFSPPAGEGRVGAFCVEETAVDGGGAGGDVPAARGALSVAVGALSGWKKRLPQQRGGHFCAATFAGPDGKGRCPRRSSALWAKKHLRGARGHFCAAMFAEPGGKGRCPQRSSAFRTKKMCIRDRYCQNGEKWVHYESWSLALGFDEC